MAAEPARSKSDDATEERRPDKVVSLEAALEASGLAAKESRRRHPTEGAGSGTTIVVRDGDGRLIAAFEVDDDLEGADPQQPEGTATEAPNRQEAIAQVSALLADLDSERVGTSMRLPKALRAAAEAAVALGFARSTSALTATALRNHLEGVVMEAALEEHYEAHPDLRPSLAELALAAAQLDGHPLAGQPDVIAEAAEAVMARQPDADPDVVLTWAEATAAASSRPRRRRRATA